MGPTEARLGPPAQLPNAQGITAFRRLDYGHFLRMQVLDTRSHRSDQPCNDGRIQPCPTEADVSPTMLGSSQENWLDEGFGNDTVWNLVAQQVLTMPYARHNPGQTDTWTSYDTWDGYHPARARLIDSIRRHNLTNVVIASGDFHRNFVGTLPESDEREFLESSRRRAPQMEVLITFSGSAYHTKPTVGGLTGL